MHDAFFGISERKKDDLTCRECYGGRGGRVRKDQRDSRFERRWGLYTGSSIIYLMHVSIG